MSKLAPVKQKASLKTLSLVLSHYRRFHVDLEVNEFNTGYMLRVYDVKCDNYYIVRCEVALDYYSVRIVGLGLSGIDSSLLAFAVGATSTVLKLRGVKLSASPPASDEIRG